MLHAKENVMQSVQLRVGQLVKLPDYGQLPVMGKITNFYGLGDTVEVLTKQWGYISFKRESIRLLPNANKQTR